MAKVFVVRYALSSGISEMETEILKSNFEGGRDYVKYRSWAFLYIGKDAFLSKEYAIKKAEEMRKKKITSLRKQIEKLEKMKF